MPGIVPNVRNVTGIVRTIGPVLARSQLCEPAPPIGIETILSPVVATLGLSLEFSIRTP